MLKSSGFAKTRITRAHTGMFNPLTLSVGAEQELDRARAEQIEAPSYSGSGAVYRGRIRRK